MSLGSKPAKYEQFTPPDLQGFRGQQIGLLQALLGLPGTPQSGGGAGPSIPGLPSWLDPTRNRRNAANAANGAMAQGAGMVSGDSPGARLESFFGGLNTKSTPLQRQSMNALGHFMGQMAPEQRALDVSMPMLQGILDGRPGAGIIDALQPTFERNLSAANQQGGRFGSGNAILRSRAVDDFNLLGAQAAQQGQQTQLQAAQMLNMLSQAAGQNPFQRMLGAYGVGQQDFQNQDLETQRRLQLMMGLLGVGQGLAFNQPVVQTQQGGGGWGGLLGTLAGSFLGPVGAAAGGALGGTLFPGGGGGISGGGMAPSGLPNG